MRFTFEVAGKKEMDRAFNRVKDHIEDLRPIWPPVTREMQNIMEEQFKSAGASGRSGEWKALSPKYALQKVRRHMGPTMILRDSGAMMKSLTGKTSDSAIIEDKQEFGFGTKLFYAAFHQTGTDKMPAREIFSFTEDNRRDITKAMQKELLKLIKSDRQVTQSLEVQE